MDLSHSGMTSSDSHLVDEESVAMPPKLLDYLLFDCDNKLLI